MNIYALLALGSCLFYFILGGFVIHLNAKRPLNQLFFLGAVFAGIYCFAEFGYLQAESASRAQVWLKVRSVWTLTFCFVLHFHLIFLKSIRWLYSWWRMVIIYLPGIFFFIADLFTNKITGQPIFLDGFYSFDSPENSILHQLSGIYPIIYTLITLGISIYAYRIFENRSNKSQAFYLILANLLIILAVIVNTFLLKIPRFSSLHIDSILFLGSNGIIAYAVWRANFMRFLPHIVYQEIISNMSNFLILVTPDFIIKRINPSTENITGYSKRELEGEHLEILFKDLSKLYKYSRSYDDTGEALLIKNKSGYLLSKSKEKVPINYSISTIPLEREDKKGFLIVGSEYTEVDAIEGKLKNKTLELKLSNQSIEDFTRILTLDFKSSILVINGFSELLMKNQYDFKGKSKTYLENIGKESLKMYKMIDELNQITAIDHQSNIQLIDLNDTVSEVISDLKELINKNHAKVTVTRLPIVSADEKHMQMLFSNLISNSIIFRSEARPIIQISAERADLDYCKFSIKDNGVGIKSGYYKKIFNLFEQLNEPGSPHNSGNGIGLTLCKKIIHKYEGRIWVESKLGKGSVFHFSLPHASPTPKNKTSKLLKAKEENLTTNIEV